MFHTHFASSLYIKKWRFHQIGPGPMLNRVLSIHVLYAIINYMLRYTKCESVIAKHLVDSFWQPFFFVAIYQKWRFHQLCPGLILNRTLAIHVIYAVINYMLRYTKGESVIANEQVDIFWQPFCFVAIYQKVTISSVWPGSHSEPGLVHSCSLCSNQLHVKTH